MTIHAKLAAGAAALAGALLLPALASATATPIPIPAVPGVAGLPGPIAPTSVAAQSMAALQVSPDTGLAGEAFTVAGAGLPANRDVALVWSTANVTWVVDPRPDSVDYLGRQATKLQVVLGSAHTDSTGSFSTRLVAPHDFGGIHDIYAVVNGLQIGHGGFLIPRAVAISPKRGPIGTPITITYSGLGASLYEGGASLLYDNRYVGAIMANWTRGTAVVHIRASGPVGRHTIEVADAISFKYLNIQQSPIPWANGGLASFTVTRDAGRPKPAIGWPDAVQQTLDARTTLQLAASTDPSGGAAASAATATLASASGAVFSKTGVSATGLVPGAPVDLEWATVVGNRVNCTGTCWTFVSVPLGTGTAAADGTLTAPITVPDGLGGWHVVQLIQNGKVMAQLPYYVRRSFAAKPLSSLVLHEGQRFTVHLKGLGWTQLDNTIAVDYDNSYVGYGCGFNSQGDAVMNLVATGGPGTHLIDMYPLLYTQQPSYASTPYGMVPVLTYGRDAPGLALGYQLPAMRLAITVVK